MNIHTSYLIVCLMSVVCVQRATAFDCPTGIKDCTCNIDYLSCSHLQVMPQLPRGSLVTYLQIWASNITTISTDSLPPGLQHLLLSGNPLTNISDDAFDQSANTLNILEISTAKITKIPRALLRLTNLTKLDITESPVEDFDDQVMQHLATNLKILTLRVVPISVWPSWISHFQFLTDVDFSGTLFQSLPENAFSSFADSLETLKLRFMRLTQIPKALKTLTNLVSLDLSGNNFIDIHELENVFPFSSKLSTLTLTSVGLAELLNFTHFSSLKEIDLRINNISDLNEGLLPPSVTKVIMTNNHLTSVPTAVAGMSKLSHLGLGLNFISSIEPDSFPSSLDSLDLSDNHISDIKSGPFPSHVTDLDLIENQIALLPSQTFPPSLSTLNLRDNNLTVITNTTFANLTKLRILLLNNNPITTISVSAFVDLKSLSGMFLDFTDLTEIPLALAYLSEKAVISLSGISSISCPCPPASELVSWYRQASPTFAGTCSNGHLLYTYFEDDCITKPTSRQQQTTPSTASNLQVSRLSIWLILCLCFICVV